MSIRSPNSLFSSSIESPPSKRDSHTSDEHLFSLGYDRPNAEGFSSSLILNFDTEKEKNHKPYSKLINITQIVPGTQNQKKLLLPIFYRKSSLSSTSKALLYLEQNSSSLNESSDSVQEKIADRQEVKKQIVKPNRVTSTTLGSMHTLSNIDGEVNHELFSEKVNFDYETEVKSSMHEGNLIAYCHKCKKETVTVMKPEKIRGFKGIRDFIFCCCSNWSIRGKTFVCPMCLEELLKVN